MSDTVKASHILVMHIGSQNSSSGRSKEEALEHIETIVVELANGLEFAHLAAEHSECPSSKDGGNLGVFGRGDMVPEFDDVVFELGVGDVSSVVETAFGYHIIQRTG